MKIFDYKIQIFEGGAEKRLQQRGLPINRTIPVDYIFLATKLISSQLRYSRKLKLKTFLIAT